LASRKAFIAGAASIGVALAAAKRTEAQSTPAPAAPVAPPATPKPSPTPKPPSDAARTLAERMRAFDKNLSDADITTIARNIDGNLDLGKALNAKGRRLKNWDEPSPFFRVSE
jgi:hypothetical protein